MTNSKKIDEQVELIRTFNRFYTKQIGLLDEGLLNSKYTLTEVRVLYELGHVDGLTATDIKKQLELDSGYLSRLLKKFENEKLISRSKSPNDSRQSLIALTTAGNKILEPLIKASSQKIENLLLQVSVSERKRLIDSMHSIQNTLNKKPKKNKKETYTLRSLQVGDIGWITHRQGLIYKQEYGFDESFEGLVAEISASYIKSLNPKKENCWIAVKNNEIVGSVFLVQQSMEIAKLRLLYVEPSARGLGIGQKLVEECINFSRKKNYTNLTFWTNDVLVSARRIYQATGFTLVKEEPHHSFGKDLVGQVWNMQL